MMIFDEGGFSLLVGFSVIFTTEHKIAFSGVHLT